MKHDETRFEQYKTQLYRQFAQVGRAVSNPKRLELLELLSQSERNVEDLARETQMSVSSVSQHLHGLRAAGMVDSRKDGLYVRYRLADDAVGRFLRSLQELALGRSAAAREIVATFIDQRDEFEPLGHEELLRRAREGNVTVLDVRPRTEYAAGHIPDARSIPLAELEKRLDELPPGREIVAYCRGPYCLLSVDAVLLLRQHGLSARRLEGGLPEWRSTGHRVETDRQTQDTDSA